MWKDLHTPPDWEGLQRMLEQTLIPPGSVVELDESSLRLYNNRITGVPTSIAELYHMNSQIAPGHRARLLPQEERNQMRAWYFETMGHIGETVEGASVVLLREVDATLPWLGPFAERSTAAQMLYGVDLVVSTERLLWKVLPGAGKMVREAADPNLFDRILHEVEQSNGTLRSSDGTDMVGIAITASLPRLSIQMGARAYRQLCFDAGQVTCVLTQAATATGWKLIGSTEFEDAVVNDLLGLDGEERFALYLGVVTSGDNEQ